MADTHFFKYLRLKTVCLIFLNKCIILVPSNYLAHLLTVGHSQLTVMSTVWTSVSMSLTAVHWYVPALCLLIDGISRYSSSDAISPAHVKNKRGKKTNSETSFRGWRTEWLLAMVHISSISRKRHVNWCLFLLPGVAKVVLVVGCNSSTYEDVCSWDETRTAAEILFLVLTKKHNEGSAVVA